MATAEAKVRLLVSAHVAPLLKQAGFRKTRLNWHRRRGSAVHVINLQQSRWNSSENKEFFINIAFALDELCELTGAPIHERIPYYHCDSVGGRKRLESLAPRAPSSWTVSPGTDIDKLGTRLCRFLSSIVKELDQIDSPQAFADHPWFQIEWWTALRENVLRVLHAET